ncbi:hypothetical protein CARUB_v10015810mg [Capsella rubella]|uniref:Exostosin GT47 domain-containing protein n=1 Tax=Capsella rubella TaxID=81985 RepID=R0I7U3_9BRAS|nr:hypothetical protein CARUB_v10015810mg [Capsella rubella]
MYGLMSSVSSRSSKQLTSSDGHVQSSGGSTKALNIQWVVQMIEVAEAHKFYLNPAGDTPSACRLFDSIVSLCVPVIVSDSIELPFEDVIDYRKFSIFVEANAALQPGFLVKMLRKIKTKKILEYQREMRSVKRYFDYDNPNGAVKEIWRQVSQKLPLIKLMSNRDRRLVLRNLTEPNCSCLCTNQTGLITSI